MIAINKSKTDYQKSNQFLQSNRKVAQLINQYPVLLDSGQQDHVLVFRRILELSLSQGRWFGQMSAVS